MNGIGFVIYENGFTYCGQWKNEARNGYGMHNTHSGVIHYGRWINHITCGEGAVIDKNGETIGEGVFSNYYMKHKSNNLRAYILLDGLLRLNGYTMRARLKTTEHTEKAYLYCLKVANTRESTLKESSMASESSLGNTFIDNMCSRANGKKYEGKWAYNLMNGEGTMIQANGKERKGFWYDNEF